MSNLKVVQDNVSGSKHSAFSEDQSTNRADEQTVSDIKIEAENRVIENEKKKLREEEESQHIIDPHMESVDTTDDIKQNFHENVEHDINTNEGKNSPDYENEQSNDHKNVINEEELNNVKVAITEEEESLINHSDLTNLDPETEIVDLDKVKDKIPVKQYVNEEKILSQVENNNEKPNIEPQEVPQEPLDHNPPAGNIINNVENLENLENVNIPGKDDVKTSSQPPSESTSLPEEKKTEYHSSPGENLGNPDVNKEKEGQTVKEKVETGRINSKYFLILTYGLYKTVNQSYNF